MQRVDFRRDPTVPLPGMSRTAKRAGRGHGRLSRWRSLRSRLHEILRPELRGHRLPPSIRYRTTIAPCIQPFFAIGPPQPPSPVPHAAMHCQGYVPGPGVLILKTTVDSGGIGTFK